MAQHNGPHGDWLSLMVAHSLRRQLFVVCSYFRVLNQWGEDGILLERICVDFCQALGHFQPRCSEMRFSAWVFPDYAGSIDSNSKSNKIQKELFFRAKKISPSFANGCSCPTHTPSLAFQRGSDETISWNLGPRNQQKSPHCHVPLRF